MLNRHKLTAPDTRLGRFLIGARAAWQLHRLRGREAGAWDPDFARLARRLTPVHTMVSIDRLKALHDLGAEIARRGVRGAVVECGVWNGGSSAMVAAGLARAGDQPARAFWLFDSFEGLPSPSERDGEVARADYFPGWCTGSIDRVREAHRIACHSLDHVEIVPGWFDETLAPCAAAIGPIALLHIDADWYDSVTAVLAALYDRVVPGGVVIIDDYGSWSGCREAVHDYFGEAGVAALEFQAIDGCAVYFWKP